MHPPYLEKIQGPLQRLVPDEQTTAYTPDHWAATFGDDPDFGSIVQQYPGHLTRGDVAGLAAEARQDDRGIRRAFLASMMWAYGRVGDGPSRTWSMLADERAGQVLEHTFALLLAGDIREAYERLTLNQCAPALFTKYFSCIGLGCQLPHPRPLILDVAVVNALETLLGMEIAPFATVTRDGYGRIASVGRDAEGYGRYLEQVHAWANTLQCRPDAIEYYLSSLRKRMAVGAELALEEDEALDLDTSGSLDESENGDLNTPESLAAEHEGIRV